MTKWILRKDVGRLKKGQMVQQIKDEHSIASNWTLAMGNKHVMVTTVGGSLFDAEVVPVDNLEHTH